MIERTNLHLNFYNFQLFQANLTAKYLTEKNLCNSPCCSRHPLNDLAEFVWAIQQHGNI